MERLITFGCSHTYGHGLPDCIGLEKWSPGPSPSKLGWVAQLAEALELPYSNYAEPGASVKEVALRFLDQPIKENSLVVILWPFYPRTCFIQLEGDEIDYEQFLINADNIRFTNYYSNFYSELDALHTNNLYIKMVNSICKLKNCTVVNAFSSHEEYDFYNTRYEFVPEVGFHGLFIHGTTEDGHLSLEGNRIYKDILLEYIEQEVYKSKNK